MNIFSKLLSKVLLIRGKKVVFKDKKVQDKINAFLSARDDARDALADYEKTTGNKAPDQLKKLGY